MGKNDRNFCRNPFWGYLGPYMTKIWIFAKPSKWTQKASLGIKLSRSCPKRAWGAYLHPAGTLWGSWLKTKISWFWPQNPQVEISDVPYGCKYSPQALFGAFLAAKMLQDAFPDDIDRLQKIWILVISGPKQAFFAPKLDTCRDFCPPLEAYGHVPDIRKYFIQCEGD